MKSYKYIVTGIFLSLCINVIAQAPPIYININSKQNGNGNQEKTARDYIQFLPGFLFDGQNNEIFKTNINDELICDADYLTSEPDPNRSLDITLSVGTIPGEANVTPTGAATYTIPIEVPPGTAGMVPKLSLVYNSQAGNGLLGMGWNLAGLSAITRTQQDFYHDSFSRGLDFSRDQFALDGNRLIARNKAYYGRNDTTHYTENESFSRITSFSPLYGVNSHNPYWFKVETKDGYTMEYGNSFDSKILKPGQNDIVYIWMLNKITDANGNYITIQYYNDPANGIFAPKLIKYTANDLTNPVLESYNSIKFYYINRNDKNEVFIDGSVMKQNVLLYKVKVFNENNIIREYKLEYFEDNLLYPRLSTITQTGIGLVSNNKLSYNKTIINYNTPTTNFIKTTTNLMTLNYYGSDYDYISGDFTGDGYDDLVALHYSYSNGFYYDYYYLLTNSGDGINFSEGSCQGAFNQYSNTVIQQGHIQKGDFNGDGIADLFADYTDGHYAVFLANPISSCGFSYYSNTNWTITWLGSTLKICDFDGDSKSDILECHYTNYGFELYIDKWDNFNYEFINLASRHHYNYGTNYSKIEIIDFDGDGSSDIICIGNNLSTIYRYDLFGGYYTTKLLYNGGYPTTYHHLHFGDFNGDRKTDILSYSYTSGWSLDYSNGLNFTNGTCPITDPIQPDYCNNSLCNIIVADFNSDGKDDILKLTYPNTAEDAFTFYYSNGNNFIPEEIVVSNSDLSICIDNIILGNFNGDDRIDILNKALGYPYKPNNILYFHPFEKKYIVSSIIDGLNRVTLFAYDFLTNPNLYTIGAGATFPVNDIRFPFYVVRAFDVPNGKGGSREMEYTYTGAKLHRQGKGFLGFSTVTTYNQSTGLSVVNHYSSNNSYFYPKLDQTETFDNNINAPLFKINESFFNYIFKDFNNYGRFFPYVTQSNSFDYLKEIWVVNKYCYKPDDVVYGNLTYKSDSSYSKDINGNYVLEAGSIINYVYTNSTNSGTWCPSKVQYLKTTRYKPNTATTYYPDIPFIRETEFNFTNGKLISQVNDPSTDPADKPETLSFQYNQFGNLISSTISANGLQSRQELFDYDTKERFVITKENALGHTAEFTYEPVYGNILFTKDANVLQTENTYDAFGRLTSSKSPLGNTTTYTTSWYTGSAITYALYYTTINSPGSSPVIAYKDILGRVIYQESSALSGIDQSGSPIHEDVIVEYVYNPKGQLEKQSKPRFSGTTAVWTNYEYDVYGRQYYVISPACTTEFIYDKRKTTVKTINNSAVCIQEVSKTTDAVGNVLKAEDEGGEIIYDYFSSCSVTEIHPPGGAKTTITNDKYGRQITLNDPDAGPTYYNYNAFGELIYQKDARNNIFEMTYDKLGRLLTKQNTSVTITNTYDADPLDPLFPKGQLYTTTNSSTNSTTTYHYDEFVRPDKITESIFNSNQIFETDYTYDQFGRLIDHYYPVSNPNDTRLHISNSYDIFGNLLSVNNENNSTVIWQFKIANALGQIEQYVQGDGIKVCKTYDQFDFLSTIQTKDVFGVIKFQDFAYSFNNVTGNLTSRIDNNQNLTETFTYDQQNRLVQANNTLYISYDNGTGNISGKTNAGDYIYDISKIHQVVQINNPNYISNVSQNISYTSFNKIDEITEVPYDMKFYYGPELNRIKMEYTNNNTLQLTRYYSIDYEKEIDNINNNIRELNYIYAGDGLAAIFERKNYGSPNNETMYFIYKDHLGSICYVTDANATVIESMSYDAWGKRRNPADWSYLSLNQYPTLFDRGYTQHEHMDEFELINMNGRLYDPVLGRFLSPDNYVQSATNTQAYNRYSYCLNNPLKFNDPSGESILLAAAAGALLNVAIQGVSGNLHNIEDFGSAALIGAVGGMVGGIAGEAVSAALGTATSSGGAILNGAITGATGGFAGGFVGGTGNAWMNGANFDQGLQAGLVGGGYGALGGAILGGVSGGIKYHKQMVGFRNGCENLGVEPNGPVPKKDYFLCDAQNAWCPDAPVQRELNFTVEHVPNNIFTGGSLNKLGATVPEFANRMYTGNSNVYFNGNTTFSSAKQLYFTMLHEIGHVSQFASLSGLPASLWNTSFPYQGNLVYFEQVMDFHAYNFQNTLGGTELSSYPPDFVRALNNRWPAEMILLNIHNYSWTSTVHFHYPF